MSIAPARPQVRAFFAAPGRLWPLWQEPLERAFAEAGLPVVLSQHCPDPAEVDYLIYAPGGPVADFTAFRRARAVLSLWAGVERIVGDPTLRLPLARMVDDGLRQGMCEYVAGHVLRQHLGIDRLAAQPGWHPVAPPLASERPVTVLGLGELGRAVASTLAALGFPVTGWSRRPRQVDGIRCLHGTAGLDAALAGAQVLALLLPLTPATESLIGAERLARLAPGAHLVNPGRGGLIDDAALLDALDRGGLGHATLDTFRTEPLPPDHPFWQHPRITVTPHIAAETRPATAARCIAENIRRGEAGLPFLHLVDRAAGY